VEMHQIRYFQAAARSLSFTRAAEACHVSQPAPTAAVKKLEGELGGVLFFREGNRLVLTEFGRRMAPLMSDILDRTEAAASAAENFRLLAQQPVRVGVMPTLGPVRVARFLAAFERANPGVEVAVREGAPASLSDWLEADTLDAAIMNPVDPLGAGYRAEPLYTERYVVLLPPEHALRARNEIGLGDLHEQPYVDRLACEMRESVMSVCGKRGVILYARFRSELEDWVQAMVAANLGFAFMPEYSVTNLATIQRPLADPPVARTVSLVTMSGRPLPAAVMAFLRGARSYRWLE
jgi:DNA-binding transcriptional LysR family regulator